MFSLNLSVIACVLVSAGVTLAGGPDLHYANLLYDNGQVNPQGVKLVGDEFVSPSGLIYDNGEDDYRTAAEFTFFLEADDFTLNSDATLGSVNFSISTTILDNNLSNFDGTINWFIYANGDNIPGAEVASGLGKNVVVLFDQFFAPNDWWDASFDLDVPLELTAGTYWLGLNLNDNNCNTRDELYWGTTKSHGTNHAKFNTRCSDEWGNLGIIEFSFALFSPSDCLTMKVNTLIGGGEGQWDISGATPGMTVAVVYGLKAGSTVVKGQMGFCATFGIKGINAKNLVGLASADGDGNASVSSHIPAQASGLTVLTQAAGQGTCPEECVSNLDMQVIQ